MTDTGFADISQRRDEIQARIAVAAERAGRSERPIFVAVSKVQPDARIEAALAAGHRVFGENRVQEAQARWAERRAQYPDLSLRLIGPLQTNKAEAAASLFDVIETLDRPKLARALASALQKTGRSVELLIQVNTGEEPQKAGVLPEGLEALLTEARGLNLNVTGLMCIPPSAEPAGPHFALLGKLAQRHGLANLSMGMSADYAVAVAYGASHLRIGSAFFGAREVK